MKTMRKFSSYGPIDKDIHYYVPRAELLKTAYTYLVGNIPGKGGHYFTVWSARQTGKSSLLRDVYWELLQNEEYAVANIDIQNLKDIDDPVKCMNIIIEKINTLTNFKLPQITAKNDFETVFTAYYLEKPLILIIDEFDALEENVISDIVSVFRNIYNARQKDPLPSFRKRFLLHGVALIGVRSVVGVENQSGSPFNVQRSLYVHNLTTAEVNEMYYWYMKETGQVVEQDVIDRIYHVTRGQPGLVSWFGELLAREQNKDTALAIGMKQFDYIYKRALCVEPNNNIINIISKARMEPYRNTVLELFSIDRKMEFRFEKPEINYLYMHGVVSYEEDENSYYVRFPCQFIQEKLFHYFTDELVQHNSRILADPYIDLTDIINDNGINIHKLLSLYQAYYTKNKEDLLKYAKRRVDMRIMEVVYHFQLYSWLDSFLTKKQAKVLPEFPTGNGKIDLLIKYKGRCYGLELKSFSDFTELRKSVQQASAYGKSLGLAAITLVVFLELPMPDERKEEYAGPFKFKNRATVNMFFLVTG